MSAIVHWTAQNLASEYAHSSFSLDWQVEDFGWPRGQAPPLERLYVLCRTAHDWLLGDVRNVLVVHCQVSVNAADGVGSSLPPLLLILC